MTIVRVQTAGYHWGLPEHGVKMQDLQNAPLKSIQELTVHPLGARGTGPV